MKTCQAIFFALAIYPVTILPLAAQPGPRGNQRAYTIEQATSDRAQLHTIAFDGLAFLTGNYGADCFFPPGKVADFFGFQYMRDNDSNQLGHNTDFLTRIASNVIALLDKDQLDLLKALAIEQEPLYDEFARKRMVLIRAFRQSADPQEKRSLSREAVVKYCGELYRIDAQLSYRRAEVVGRIVRSFSDVQKKKIDEWSFGNSDTWPRIPEQLDKRSLSHRAHVGVMTYASELFSWYKGSLKADVYFCPERHGTYFGGFYMKDYPAMGNPGYFIPTSLTGESGREFLNLLRPEQRQLIEALPGIQRKNLEEIVRLRTSVCTELRMFLTGGTADRKRITDQVVQYGEQDGELSFAYITAFAGVARTLDEMQLAALRKLRNQDVLPQGAYLYSDPVPLPAELDCSFLFSPNPSQKTKAF